MSTLDWIVIAAYLALTLGMSAYLARGQFSPDDYYVGGRTMPWWALALSTLATQSSANSFIGIPAFVALVPGGGLSWLQYELMLPLAMVVIAVLLMPVFRTLRLISVYEYLELRFDRPTRLVLSGVFLLSRGLATGVALYAVAVLVEVCTGLPLAWCVVIVGGVTVVYDTMGGMQAVVWTDVMQMMLMVLGIVACGAIALQLAGGVAPVLAALDPSRLDAVQWAHGIGDGARAPLWGFVAGGLVLYISYYGVDQSQVQRQLAAVSVHEAQRMLWLNGLARFPLTLLYAGLGVAVGAVYLQHEALRAAVPAGKPDYLIPYFITMYLPSGIRGLLVAAILAAAMSSRDSALNSLSAATMRDFVEPHITPSRRLVASRWITAFWGTLIVVFGLFVGDLADNLVEGINQVGALFYGPLLAAFLCGILDRRARGPAVLAGVALGLLVNLALYWGLGATLFWMWWNVTGLVVAVLTTVIASRLMPAVTPAPGTVLDGAALRTRLADAHRFCIGLVAYGVVIAMVVVALDRR
ncbi:sodium/solute symporter [Aquincola sp. S2]|uniref:Sodium/solute symporter n=1 Tax=Pseudaquabacterium terrae TaxID=2732868 RepID=A0ABX2EUG5_9BURK|nr:sodium/solute symporter [Aquabacterium terrae]NRF72127.1 sodium/solute symporter [Aquabacterium terrae]